MYRGHGTLLPMTYPDAMIQVGKTVCQIFVSESNKIGSGFLIGKDVVVTCEHVIQERAARSTEFLFDYKDVLGGIGRPKKFHGHHILFRDKEIDVILIQLDEQVNFLEESSYKKLLPYPRSTTAADFFDLHRKLTIIQHPLGNPQQMSSPEELYRRTDQTDKPWDLIYKIATLPGSSGAPVVDEKGIFVGVHSGTGYQGQDEMEAHDTTNLGVFVNDIVDRLNETDKAILDKINFLERRTNHQTPNPAATAHGNAQGRYFPESQKTYRNPTGTATVGSTTDPKATLALPTDLPTQRQLNILSREIAGRWRPLATALDVPSYVCDQIKADNRDQSREQAYEMLKWWKRKNSEKPPLESCRKHCSLKI
eukprot:m.171708 g.171708  ORF g.171708 m.171708 type:complete len:366 (+) comp39071_c0_seq5:148-1245(+)